MTSTEIVNTTRFKKHQVSFTWKIENWSVVSRMQKEFYSKKFLLREIDLLCYFFFHFNAYKKTSNRLNAQNCYLVGLCTVTRKTLLEPIKVIKCSIVKDENAVYTFSIYDDPSIYVNDQSVKSLMSLASQIPNGVVNDSVSILIKIEYCDSNNYSELEISEGFDFKQNVSIFKNYHNLYEKQELCDVTFVIKDDQIKAHTFVLALASSYFHSMFTQDTEENKNRVVNFSDDPDITLEVFQGVLEFIYNIKNISELRDIIYELVIIADKFDMKDLQKSCEEYLAGNIDKNNAAKILILSHKHNCKFLKQKALAFVRIDSSVITHSVEFSEICKDENLMSEILRNKNTNQ